MELFLGRSVPMFRKLTATKRPKSSKTKLVKLKLRSNAVHCHLLCPLKKASSLPEATKIRTIGNVQFYFV